MLAEVGTVLEKLVASLRKFADEPAEEDITDETQHTAQFWANGMPLLIVSRIEEDTLRLILMGGITVSLDRDFFLDTISNLEVMQNQ